MINRIVEKFKKEYSDNPEVLIAERLSMPEATFARNHNVSPQRVCSIMGPVPNKKLVNYRKVILDPVKVHELRLEGWSDVRIAQHFHTSNSSISQQCGDRKSNGFKPNKRGTYKDTDLGNRDLNTKSWPVVKEGTESWRKEGEVVNPGEGPISILKQFQKGW